MTQRIIFSILITLTISATGISCNMQKPGIKFSNNNQSMVSSPPVVVYKTRENYFDKVPVTLSADGKTIVAYPAQNDLMREGKFSYPTQLNDGYLLDNRGITPNTAFLRFSYEDYYNMDNVPNAQRLMNYILDAKPFTEFYEVGSKGDYDDAANEINQMISEKKFRKLENLAK
jgi:hypothetical protein